MANENINLDLSLEEINIVLTALGELPAKASMGVNSKDSTASCTTSSARAC